MSEHITATLNGRALLELKIELARGAKPSSFEATLAPGEAPSGEVELVVADAETRRVFHQFHVTRTESLGDGRVRVFGEDRRREWQRPVRADINVPIGDGTAWREGEPVSAQVAIGRLFAAAGLDGAPILPGGTPAPVNVRASGTLGRTLETMLASVGLAITVNDSGEYEVTATDAGTAVDASRLLSSAESVAATPSQVTVLGGPALELVEVSDWETVIPDDAGELREIGDVLAEWGVSESAARQACLSDGGFETLLPQTGAHAAARLAKLKRYAYRLFRATAARLPWLPVGGLHEDGSFRAPVLSATVARPRGTAPGHPADSTVESTSSEPIEEYELDAEEGLVFLAHPPFALQSSADPTLQNRAMIGEPRLSLIIAHAALRPPFTLEVATSGSGEPLVASASHLLALYEEGEMLNRAMLRAAANVIAARVGEARVKRTLKLAGVASNIAAGTCARVVIAAGASGLTTTIEDSPTLMAETAAIHAADPVSGKPAAPMPSGLHQPINAYRAGPLVLRAEGETPEGEAVLAMEALHRRDDTGALELVHPGPLAFPFFADSTDAAKFGRWFFVAGVEVADSGRLRILGPDQRHAELSAEPLFETRHALPKAVRGLIVSMGGDPQFVDVGPLVSDSRGTTPGETSSLVYDLDGSRVSKLKRGGLQFLSVLALSPAHKDEGCRDGGWVPALNLREGDTGSPEVQGRGLFAEGSGRDLGRLTASLQGGPVLADPAACSKHLYGTASDDGVYRESAGHISTDAFFKIPGDPVHDAPVKFYAEDFEGGVPPWPPYEAQLKYDPAEKHPWNRKLREGRWKIQYRVPFTPTIPPTWKPPIGPPPVPPVDDPPAITVPAMSCLPYDIRPAVSENELWAPSHDWVPAPSDREQELEVTYPGPSIKSQGWAGEIDGVPTISLGGGCIYLPPGMSMPEAQTDGGTRQTFIALHPEVVLAFGHPHFGVGRVHSGWAMRLAAAGGHLELSPLDVDASTPPGMASGVHITGHVQVGPVDAAFGAAHALRLGENPDEGIAFGTDATLYRQAEATLRTDGNLEVGAKLTVAGLIDPTGLQLEPQAANPGDGHTVFKTDGAPGGGLAPNRPYVGADRIALHSELPAGGVTSVGGAAPITSSGGATPVISLDDDGVTYAKMQNISAASRLLGRGSAAGAGDPQEITLGTNLSMSGTTLNAAGGSGGDLALNRHVLASDFTITVGYAAYITRYLELAAGVTLTIEADGDMEIG